jgi:hypothetical protein
MSWQFSFFFKGEKSEEYTVGELKATYTVHENGDLIRNGWFGLYEPHPQLLEVCQLYYISFLSMTSASVVKHLCIFDSQYSVKRSEFNGFTS